jgi:hypothetical protein
MSPETPRNEPTPLDREDARLVARVRDAWAPEPLTPVRRAVFDAGLQERLDAARRRRGLWPALGAGLVAASLGALLMIGQEPAAPPAPVVVAAPEPTPEERERTARAAALLYASVDDEDERDAEAPGLPLEYAAIAGVFLDR